MGVDAEYIQVEAQPYEYQTSEVVENAASFQYQATEPRQESTHDVYVYEDQMQLGVDPMAQQMAVPENEMLDPQNSAPPLGELFVDRTAPESLAPWLLLLDANAMFVIHLVDSNTSYRTMANPHGKIPTWIDADGSCLWESNAVMRYLCLKHKLDPQFYATNDLNLRTRTDMALDWCTTVLFPHIRQVLDPTGYERHDATDLATAKLYLDMDFKILTDYFLRETPFVGGEYPNIADYAIGMQCLMLFATDYPLADKVRSYLYNIAENSENWNEVTGTLRDHCTAMQQEHRAYEIEADRRKKQQASFQRQLEDERFAQQVQEQQVVEEEAWKQRMEDEKQQREAEYQRRCHEMDEAMERGWNQRAQQEEQQRSAEEGSWKSRMTGKVEDLKAEIGKLREEETAAMAAFMAKKAEQEKELEELETVINQWKADKQAREEAEAARAEAEAKAAEEAAAKAASKPAAKPGVRKAAKKSK